MASVSESRFGLERMRVPLYQPFVEFLRIMYVVRVWYDGVDELPSPVYASAAFIR